MKKLLIAAGLAGLAYYLKKNPKAVDKIKESALDAFNKVKSKADHSTQQ
jgi:hypothetical protein